MQHPRLAFVDVETTGVGATHERIADIGVVTVDRDVEPPRFDEWGALVDPGRRIADLPHEFGRERAYFAADRASEQPRFADIARELTRRLDNRLVVAHNAPFDEAFLRAEFERIGAPFAPPVMCSLQVARRLYPALPSHDLDALAARFGIAVTERHLALPDARLLSRVFLAMEADVGVERMAEAIDAALTEPLLPPHLDRGMLDALPDEPGVFALLDAGDKPLLIGRAANLRRHLVRYFQIQRQCFRADAFSHRLARIRWERASGHFDARLREIALRRSLDAEVQRGRRPPPRTIDVDPSAMPAVSVVPAHEPQGEDSDRFGLFATERKALNALRKLAASERLCGALLGFAGATCVCRDPRLAHTRQLMQLTRALSPLRLQPWPYSGPIAVRERNTLHVFDHWEHLGSVRTLSDMQGLLGQCRNGFDAQVYALLTRKLARLPASAVRVISQDAPPSDDVWRDTTDHLDEQAA